MHLRVKFLCWRPGGIRPGDVVNAKIVCAVRGIPHIVAVCPRQDAGERGVEVEEGPGDDSVVVEGHVQSDDTNGISYTWNRRERCNRRKPIGYYWLWRYIYSDQITLPSHRFPLVTRFHLNICYCSVRPYLWKWDRCVSIWIWLRFCGTAPVPAPCKRAAHHQRWPSKCKESGKHLHRHVWEYMLKQGFT